MGYEKWKKRVRAEIRRYTVRLMRACLVAVLLFALSNTLARSDIRGCVCDLSKPDTPTLRVCSLCLEAEKQPESTRVFFLRDVNPTKPNRWLALPRAGQHDGPTPLPRMTAAERTEVWSAAIGKARELWGDGWGLALNGDASRTQCHLHIHIGKLLDRQDETRVPGTYVRGPEEIPVVDDGNGVWVHPAGGRLHVHVGEVTTETVLLR